MTRRRVLIVDDVADLRFLLRVVLETDGAFEVIGEAGDGETAVEITERLRPEVIILDLSMPTMDGLEALPRLRALVPDATIAVLSGLQGPRITASTSTLGADVYLEKGTLPTAILDTLKDRLGIAGEPAPPPGEATGVSVLGGAELHSLVAHDLRGPLGTIIGYGDTLERRWDQLDDETRRSLLRRMTSQARVLQAIAGNLLAAQAVDVDDVEVALSPEAPAALLTDLGAALEPVAGEHPLEVRVAPDLPVVLVDRRRLTHLLVNLVTNADQHAPPGTPITLSARPDGAWVAVEVSDEGPGIPYEDRVRVLDKHVRLARDARGLGLGLFIAARFARAMGGSLAIADNDGGGTRVVCRLQVAETSG